MELLLNLGEFLSGHFTEMRYRTYWVFLLCALCLAFFVYARQSGKGWSVKGFFAYAFPKEIWLHKSAKVDYAYFAINAVLMLLIFTPLIMLVYPKALAAMMGAMQASGLPSLSGTPMGVGALYFVAFVLMTDFMVFLAHYLSHKVPFLWQFHKVHHAAEVLNPMTLYRQHPVDLLLNGLLVGTGTAFIHALFTHVFSSSFSIFTLGTLNAVFLLFYIMGYNLRHSHVRLSFGPVLDRWLISPVQHQLHHSCIEKHFDKNMGLIFAVWDRMFKTHYIPAKDEPIELGLPDGEAKEFSSAIKCYFLPFKKAFTRHKLTSAFAALGFMGLATTSMAVDDYAPPSLHLEDMTWTEVSEARDEGYKAVIIPTGGTEQNGRHVILGKHNYVIRQTSEQIAGRLGQTLIAPVLSYVPEGSISPPQGHMKYAGTISIREEAFEMILEDTANSLFAHGFTHVYVMGDSGDSVKAQERAVQTIKKDLDPGQHVLHVTDYYKNHGQVDWLKALGYSEQSIGNHAGIRDTSELMAVAPQGVRARELRQTSQDKGANGAYWKASPEIGSAMLSLKVDAAVAQISAFESPKLTEASPSPQP